MRYSNCLYSDWCPVCGEPGYPCFGWEYAWACEIYSLFEEGKEEEIELKYGCSLREHSSD